MVIAGTTLASSSVLASLMGCSESTDPSTHAVLRVGTETGLLNFVYAVVQLETDFYTRAVGNRFPGILTSEATAFDDFSNETYAERDALYDALPTGRISDAVFFTLGQVVNFSNRASTVTAAQTIEDTAARGFAAAATALQTAGSSHAALVADIATAAANRANAVRAMASAGTLTITPLSPADVMTTLAPYYLTTFTVTTA